MKKLKSMVILVILVILVFNLIPNLANAEEATTPSGISLSNLESVVDEFAESNLTKSSPGAAVIIFKDDQIIFSKGYGRSDVENDVEVDIDKTVFEIGSITKLYTWVAIMQLVESGNIDLDSSITKYLPDSFNDKVVFKQDFTLRDVMNHLAGFGEYMFDVISFESEDVKTLEEALLMQHPNQFYDVGSASAYSNYTAALAGLVIEEITGMTYNDYIKASIFDVLNMNQSTVDSTLKNDDEMRNNKAYGYTADSQGNFYKNNWSYVSLTPAGSINSTAVDVAKFGMALIEEDCPLFKNDSTKQQMLSPSYDINGPVIGTAHGFFEYEGNSYTLGHGGNTAAFSSQLTIVPEEQFGMVILTNVKAEMSFMFGLQKLLTGTSQIKHNKIVESLPSSELLEGKYVPYHRNIGYMLDFFKYLGLYQVTSIDNNEILLSYGGLEGKYLQVAPYRYKLIESSHSFINYGYDELSFVVKDGCVEGISVGHGLDLSALPEDRSELVLMASVIVLIGLVLFYIIGSIKFIIGLLRKKIVRGGPLVNGIRIIYICSLGIFVNNIVSIGRILSNNFRAYSEIMPHLIMNFPLAFIFVIVVLCWIWYYQKQDSTPRKLLIKYIYTCLVGLIQLVLLYHWNFFVV